MSKSSYEDEGFIQFAEGEDYKQAAMAIEAHFREQVYHLWNEMKNLDMNAAIYRQGYEAAMEEIRRHVLSREDDGY